MKETWVFRRSGNIEVGEKITMFELAVLANVASISHHFLKNKLIGSGTVASTLKRLILRND